MRRLHICTKISEIALRPSKPIAVEKLMSKDASHLSDKVIGGGASDSAKDGDQVCNMKRSSVRLEGPSAKQKRMAYTRQQWLWMRARILSEQCPPYSGSLA
jgi:hypothetical protein